MPEFLTFRMRPTTPRDMCGPIYIRHWISDGRVSSGRANLPSTKANSKISSLLSKQDFEYNPKAFTSTSWQQSARFNAITIAITIAIVVPIVVAVDRLHRILPSHLLRASLSSRLTFIRVDRRMIKTTR